jgi:hypothetical protein
MIYHSRVVGEAIRPADDIHVVRTEDYDNDLFRRDDMYVVRQPDGPFPQNKNEVRPPPNTSLWGCLAIFANGKNMLTFISVLSLYLSIVQRIMHRQS